MSVAAVLPPSISKEVRALALPWLACLACMVMPGITDAPRLFGPIAVVAFFLGTAALGALSIGHEYTGRTLSLLLSLPARRERLLARKLGVLAAMLLSLGLVAYTLVFGDARMPQTAKYAASFVPVLCGLCLAPLLTMACRNPIAGTVFTLGIPGLLLALGEWLGVVQYGDGPVMDAFRLTFVWFGTLGLCAIGAVTSWWMFIRLEAIEGPGQDVRLPQWLRFGSIASSAAPQLTKHNPAWLLVKKELRLQQLSLVLAALYVLEWLVLVWLANVSDRKYGDLFFSLSLLHVGLLPMLIGSSASAGERQIGTLEWQLLLPMAASKQWAIKVGVAVGLALVLGLGLPALLLQLADLLRATNEEPSFWTPAIAIVVLLTSGSLYVSSLCSSGLWALVMSLPATLGFWIFLNLVLERIGLRLFFIGRIPTEITALLVAGFIAVLLWFAFANHRSANRDPRRVWTQVILMATFVAAGVIIGAAWQAFHR